VSHELRGRGVTGSEVAKVGVGTVVGAVAGRVITGKKKGAMVGGVVGAAGGAVVAAETANQDVVVPAGSPVVVVLTELLVARVP
jgi:outer membrane protein with glycine zipper